MARGEEDMGLEEMEDNRPKKIPYLTSKKPVYKSKQTTSRFVIYPKSEAKKAGHKKQM